MPRKWTLELVKKKAEGFTRRIDFMKAEPAAYAAAVRHDWLDLIGIPRTKQVWTKKSITAVAGTHDSRAAFMEQSPQAYAAARRRKMLPSLKPLRGKWSDKAVVQKEAARYGKRTDFRYGAKGAYDKALREGWVAEFFPHDMRTTAAKKASR